MAAFFIARAALYQFIPQLRKNAINTGYIRSVYTHLLYFYTIHTGKLRE